jgi:uncharacterized membrane-anchored protein
MKYLAAVAALSLAFTPFSVSQEKAGEPEPQMSREEMQAAFMKHVESFGWTREGEGKLGSQAKINIPSGYRFSDGNGARKLMEAYGNIPGTDEVGLIGPENLKWCVLFEYEDSGYVSDKDKDDLNADAILKNLKEGQEAANEMRKEQGLDQLFITGWAVSPQYNSETNNLEWGLKLRSGDGGESINYLTRLLGRKGVMSVTLLCGPDELNTVLPEYRKLLASYAFNAGSTYGEYVKGDKLADYTLASLITAGAGFAAVKTGLFGKLGVLFAKLGKAAILVVVAVLAALKKLMMMLFGKKQTQPPSVPAPSVQPPEY